MQPWATHVVALGAGSQDGGSIPPGSINIILERAGVKKVKTSSIDHLLRGLASSSLAQKIRALGPGAAEWAVEKITQQGGGCGLCGKKRALVLDHDHTRGEARGLICYSCNCALPGQWEDSEWRGKAVKYLKKRSGIFYTDAQNQNPKRYIVIYDADHISMTGALVADCKKCGEKVTATGDLDPYGVLQLLAIFMSEHLRLCSKASERCL